MKRLIDSFIVFINISNSYSIIPYFLFFQYYRGINTSIIVMINIVYLIVRFRNKLSISLRDPLFVLFSAINIANIFIGLATNTMGWGVFPFAFANILFYIVLYNLFEDYRKKYTFNKSVWLIIRGYIWLSTLGLVSIITLFFLVSVIDINPLFNLANNTADLFKGNVERNEYVNYYHPFYISIIQQTHAIKIPFFQEYGVITGLFHEGHTATFLIIPSIFLIFGRLKRVLSKAAILSIYMLVMLIVASTTNILSMLACLLFYELIEFRKKILIPTIIIVFSVSLFILSDTTNYQFIIDKIYSRSADYSISTMIFAFTPETFFGTNFLNVSYWNDPNSTLNVGFLNFFINLAFLSLFVYRIIKINLSSSIDQRLVGLFIFYFFLHSLKITMVTYSLSYLVLIIFIINIYSNKKYRK